MAPRRRVNLDTGLLYRGVGAKVLHGADPLEAAQTLELIDLEGDHLRTPDVAQAASKVAVNAPVRAALIAFQRGFANRAGGAVLDGRDIGTVICPTADVKLFVTASAQKRARRRFDELTAKGMDLVFDDVLHDVQVRDQRDRERETAPLKPAEDAIVIDTSDMSAEIAIDHAIGHITRIRSR